MTPQGRRLAAIMADHDRGPEFALVECAHPAGCKASARIEASAERTTESLAAEFEAMGWTVEPTRCAQHAERAVADRDRRNMTEAHIEDARRQLRLGKPVAATTIRGLIEAAAETLR